MTDNNQDVPFLHHEVGARVTISGWRPDEYVTITAIGTEKFLGVFCKEDEESSWAITEGWVKWAGSNQFQVLCFNTVHRIPTDGERYVDEDGTIKIAFQDHVQNPHPVITSGATL